MLTTTRRAISYPNPDRSDRADIALHIGGIALAADADALFNQGTDAARVAAAHQVGGGRFWWATDTSLLWYDDGTSWRSVAPTSSSVGTLALRPAATSMVAGSTYFASDQIVDYITDGTNWIRKSMPAGVTVHWYKPDAAVPAGWVLYDGNNLPASTGIYADLYAHLGSTLTKPDTRGRESVGLGTHGDVSGIGVTEGLPVGSRTPKHNSSNTLSLPNHGHATSETPHNHSLTDPTHNHAMPWNDRGSGAINTTGKGLNYLAGEQLGTYGASTGITLAAASTGLTVGNPTSNPAMGGSIGPGGTRPTDSSAFIVCSKIGKL
jgi:microcystin-dependent protein